MSAQPCPTCDYADPDDPVSPSRPFCWECQKALRRALRRFFGGRTLRRWSEESPLDGELGILQWHAIGPQYQAVEVIE